MAAGTAYFPNPDAAGTSPLAQAIFNIVNVTAVFFGSDFVTVTKSPTADWIILKPMILGAIMEHFMSGEPIIRVVEVPSPLARSEEHTSELQSH